MKDVDRRRDIDDDRDDGPNGEERKGIHVHAALKSPILTNIQLTWVLRFPHTMSSILRSKLQVISRASIDAAYHTKASSTRRSVRSCDFVFKSSVGGRRTHIGQVDLHVPLSHADLYRLILDNCG